MPKPDGLNAHSFPQQTPEAIQINLTSNGFVATLDLQNAVMTMEENLQVMNSIDGQERYNFFEKTFSNIIPPAGSFATRLLAGFFEWAAIRFGARDSDPGHLTVEHLADINADGSKVAAPRAPYQLLFKPRPAAAARFNGVTMQDDFRIRLTDFPVGEVLYDVYALDKGETVEQAKLLGQLVLNSKIVASRYGDEKLYFQHNMQR